MADSDPMQDAKADTAWPSRPRALTTRGVLLVIAVLAFAVVMAAASVYLRRTQLDKTRAFWGPETILALQHGSTLRLIIPADSTLSDAPAGEEQITDLSGTPGLGHFRHALLDERHYDWTTEQAVNIAEVNVADPEFVTIELAGPPADVEPVALRLELSEGWAGAPEGGRAVRLTPRVRTAVRHFLVTLKDINAAPTS